MDTSCVRRTEFDGYSDDETVKVVMTGNQEPKFVDITDEAMANSSDVSLQLPASIAACMSGHLADGGQMHLRL